LPSQTVSTAQQTLPFNLRHYGLIVFSGWRSIFWLAGEQQTNQPDDQAGV